MYIFIQYICRHTIIIMTWLKNKSEENINSADILVNNKLYAASIHCYYYACLQLIKYVLCHKLSVDYQEQDNAKSDSHIFVIVKLYKILKRKNTKYANEFDRNINDLKYARVRADYKNVEIIEEEAIKANTKSKYIIDLINKQYMI